MTMFATQYCILRFGKAPEGHFRRMSRAKSVFTGAAAKVARSIFRAVEGHLERFEKSLGVLLELL